MPPSTSATQARISFEAPRRLHVTSKHSSLVLTRSKLLAPHYRQAASFTYGISYGVVINRLVRTRESPLEMIDRIYSAESSAALQISHNQTTDLMQVDRCKKNTNTYHVPKSIIKIERDEK